jgi:hypothetical protein
MPHDESFRPGDRRPAEGHDGQAKTLAAWFVVLGIAAVAAALSLAATREGPAVTADSIVYVSGARHLADGDGYRDYAHAEITGYAPGVSMILAGGDVLGIDAVDGARAVDALGFAALVILAFLLARRHVSRSGALWVTAGVGVSAPLLGVYSTIWSEPLFCVVTVGFVLVLEQLTLDEGRALGRVAAAGLIGGVAFFLRYPGMVLVPIGLVVIVLATWRAGARATIERLVVFAVAAGVVPFVIIVRNYLTDGSLLADRAQSTTNASSVLGDGFRTLRSWVVAGASVPAALATLALLSVIAAVIAGWWHIGVPALQRERVLFVVVGGYVAYLVVSELVTKIDPLGTRFLSPIYVPLLVLAAVAVEALLADRRHWGIIGAATIVALWSIGSLVKSVSYASQTRGGFAASNWASADFLAAVDALPSNSRIVSNVGDGIYYTTGREPIALGPRDPATLRAAVRAGAPVYLAWHVPNHRDVARPAQLRRDGFTLDAVARVPDGVVYRVRQDQG